MGKSIPPHQLSPAPLTCPPSNNDDDPDDWDDRNNGSSSSSWWRKHRCDGVVTTSGWAGLFPNIVARAFKASLTITLVLYVLNQKHMLPRPLSAIVSKVLFWPTLPITASKRMGTWMTIMDDTVILGGAPFGFLGLPERLYYKYGVRGIVNLCEEYRGPIEKYQALGIAQLYLPTTDHFEPSLHDIEAAINFIAQYQQKGERVYVHCRAGHGRSAAVVFAWLLVTEYNNNAIITKPTTTTVDDDDDGNHDHDTTTTTTTVVDLEALNQKMYRLRNVRKGLWRQPNINRFHRKILLGKKQSQSDNGRINDKDTADNTKGFDKEL